MIQITVAAIQIVKKKIAKRRKKYPLVIPPMTFYPFLTCAGKMG
jgi:hypothetical protein